MRDTTLGSGPLSTLAYGVDVGLIGVVAVDVLACSYQDLYRKYNLTSFPIQPIAGRGELLNDLFSDNQFHCAYARNSLDHTQDIVTSFRNLVNVVRDGGYIVLQHCVREGSRNKWSPAHQWDLDINENGLVAFNCHGRQYLLQENLPLQTCILHYSCPEFGGWVDLVFKKLPTTT